MEQVGPDHAIEAFIGRERLYGIILKTVVDFMAEYDRKALFKKSRIYLLENGFVAVDTSQPGDIVGYAVERPPYTRVSGELNQIIAKEYQERTWPWIEHYGIVGEDGQVLSRNLRDGLLYKHAIMDREVLGEPRSKVYIFRKASDMPPAKRRGRPPRQTQ